MLEEDVKVLHYYYHNKLDCNYKEDEKLNHSIRRLVKKEMLIPTSRTPDNNNDFRITRRGRGYMERYQGWLVNNPESSIQPVSTKTEIKGRFKAASWLIGRLKAMFR